jgi:hypothetical protein
MSKNGGSNQYIILDISPYLTNYDDQSTYLYFTDKLPDTFEALNGYRNSIYYQL